MPSTPGEAHVQPPASPAPPTRGGVVCGCANDLDAPLVCAVVWARSLKRGQEGVVDVDGVPPVALAKLAAKDLQREGRGGVAKWVAEGVAGVGVRAVET